MKHAQFWQTLMTAGSLLAASACQAELTGRFFFTPQERAALDAARQHSDLPEEVSAAASHTVTLEGFVKRSSGKTTTWINQIPQNENENPQGIAIAGKASAPQAVPLLLPSGKRVEIKAGQTYDTASGKVREGYEGAPLAEEARPELVEVTTKQR